MFQFLWYHRLYYILSYSRKSTFRFAHIRKLDAEENKTDIRKFFCLLEGQECLLTICVLNSSRYSSLGYILLVIMASFAKIYAAKVKQLAIWVI